MKIATTSTQCFLGAIMGDIVGSIAGDSDTLAAITGAVAGAYYGVPEDIQEQAIAYMDEAQRNTYQRFVDYLNRN